jgi:hypothetical protein
VYYPPPGTANVYGYNGMPMAEVAQPPPNTYSYAGMPMAEAALAVAHVRDGQESAGSFSSSSCWLLCWSWWWPWSSLSQYKMAKTDRDMVDKSVQENALEGGRVI